MSAWRKWRVGLLVLALIVIAAWAGGVQKVRKSRTQWNRPLEVAIVLLAPAAIDEARVVRLRDALGDLDGRLAAEFGRYGRGGRPFAFSLVGPIPFHGTLPFTPDSPRLVDRAKHAWRLWRTLRDIDSGSGFDPKPYDARIYMFLEPATTSGGAVTTFAEGSGAVGGEVGFVRAAAGPNDAVLALTAVAHELLHCLGATDKYDASGHTVVPDGLAEPQLAPRFPQRYAEWMAGEIPSGPGQGRLPASLAELRVGPVTAREVGWATAAAPGP